MRTIAPINSVLDRMISLSRALESAPEPDNVVFRGWDASQRGVWFPAMDCWETEQTFMVEMDLPGVHPENVDISFEQNTLTIKGERAPMIRKPESGGELRVFSAERATGSFARSVRLPEYVDGDRIEARYENGVLKLTIPKAAAAVARKIKING